MFFLCVKEKVYLKIIKEFYFAISNDIKFHFLGRWYKDAKKRMLKDK